MLIFSIPSTVIFSQTNLISNPSFEDRQQIGTGPYTYTLPTGTSDWYMDELTRCIGKYIINNTYPTVDNRHKKKSEGGCDGWYNPIDENESTPDYFHRLVDITVSPDNWVDVPDNFYSKWGDNSDHHKQEPFDDNNNSIVDSSTILDVGSEDAYVGFWNKRNLLNPNETSSYSNYAEYITQRFGDGTDNYNADNNNFLRAGHYYHIKFHVSWTNGIPTNILNHHQSGHYIKGIGAYFSQTDPFIGRNGPGSAYPLDLDDHTPGLVYNKNYFTNPTYYNQTGGTDGRNWMTVENWYRPTENKHFITIGNFQSDWNLDNRFSGPAIPNDNILRVYYFLDAVSVEEVPCSCTDNTGDGFYKIKIEPILKQPGETQCCNKVFIVFDQEKFNESITCPVNKAEIWETIGQTSTLRHTYTINNGYFHNSNGSVLIFDNLCFQDGTNHNLKVMLYDGNDLKCIINDNFTAFCPCACEPLPPPESQLNISLTNYRKTLDNKCCWDISLSNQSDCSFSLYDINLDINPDEIGHLNITTLAGSLWILHNPVSISNGNTRFTLSNPVENNGLIVPTNGNPIIIGTVCLDEGTPSTPPIQVSLSYSNRDGLCPRVWNQELLCPDCCLKINATIGTPNPLRDDGDLCCYTLNVNVSQDYNCVGLRSFEILSANVPSTSIYSSPVYAPGTFPVVNVFCVNHSLFSYPNPQPVPVKVKIIGQDFSTICITDAILNPCTNLIDKCDPGGCDPVKSIWHMKPMIPSIEFDCGDPTVHCTLNFDYWYRLCKDANDNVLHRDIEIANYSFSPAACVCFEDQIKNMLIATLNRSDLMTEFGIKNEDSWQIGEVRCYTDFRIISGDCWSEPFFFDGSWHTHLCPDHPCCYAIYRVCYEKVSLTEIKLVLNGANKPTKISETNDVSITCTPCLSNNCTKWKPDVLDAPVTHFPKISNSEENKTISECTPVIQIEKNLENINIKINCQQNGRIRVELINLLGSTVFVKELNKEGFSSSIPLDSKLFSGVYLMRIRINENIIFNDKINLIK